MWGVPARSMRSGRDIGSRRAPTWSDCSIRSSSGARDGRATGSSGRRRRRVCSCRSRTARACSSGTTIGLCEEEIAPAGARRSGGLEGIQRREAPAPRRTSAGRRRRPLGRPSAVARRDRASAVGRRRSAAACFSTGRWSNTSSISSTTSAFSRPIWGRGSSARSPVRTTRGRRRSTSTTSPAGWAGCRGCGDTSRAGWGWSRSSSATSPATPARWSLTGTPVARIIPGVGVELEGGERIESPCVVSNADPRTTLRLLGDAADPAWRARVEAIPQVGCTVKLNVALKRAAELHGAARGRGCPTIWARSTRR